MRQIFDGNRALRVAQRAPGRRNNPFGETVVDMLGESALLTSKHTQAAAAAECAEFLEFVPEPPMPLAHVLDRLARMDFPVAIGCDVRDAQIDAKHVVNINRFGRFNLGSGEQIPLPRTNARSVSPRCVASNARFL
jgi:hypothetical protein